MNRVTRMREDLAPLRRAHELLVADKVVDEIVSELRTFYGLTYVDAIAAVAAAVLLSERGIAIPQERPAWHR
jgi:hypothetical protein